MRPPDSQAHLRSSQTPWCPSRRRTRLSLLCRRALSLASPLPPSAARLAPSHRPTSSRLSHPAPVRLSPLSMSLAPPVAHPRARESHCRRGVRLRPTLKGHSLTSARTLVAQTCWHAHVAVVGAEAVAEARSVKEGVRLVAAKVVGDDRVVPRLRRPVEERAHRDHDPVRQVGEAREDVA